MNQVRTDVTVERISHRTCSKCGISKMVEMFSLRRGKHSPDRKLTCVKCEGLMRKARKQYGISFEEMQTLLSAPCSICGQPSKALDLNADKKPIAALCKCCLDYQKYTTEDTLLNAYNYAIFKRDFPFWLVASLPTELPEKPTPLLDWIDAQ